MWYRKHISHPPISIYLSSPTFVTGYPILVTLTYHHAIFSDRCTSSSLECPHNIEQSTLPNKMPPVYGPSHPTYEMTTQVYTSSPPTRESTSEFYKPTSKVYGPSTPADEPTSKIYEPSPPTYQPTSETYVTSPPKYETTTQIRKASTANLCIHNPYIQTINSNL